MPQTNQNLEQLTRHVEASAGFDDGALYAAELDLPAFEGLLSDVRGPSISLVQAGASELKRPTPSGSASFKLSTGSYGLVLPGDAGHWRWTRIRILSLGFPKEWLPHAWSDASGAPTPARRSALVASLADAIAIRLHTQTLTRGFLEGAIKLILSELESRSENPEARIGLTGRQRRQLLAHMGKTLDQPIRVEDLADIVGYSRSHFLRIFRKTFGETPYQMHLRLRLERSAELLAGGSTAVGDIAMATGFGTAAQFASAFKMRFGTPPSQWRLRQAP